MTFQNFLAMGEHGFYVWWSYGVTFFSIALLFVFFEWYKRQLIKKVNSYESEKQTKARHIKVEQISD